MIPRFSSLSSIEYESCQLGKHTRVSFLKRLNHQTKSPFELVHTDVWGYSRTASTLSFRYFVTFIDDYSTCTWLFLVELSYFLYSKNSLLRFALNLTLLYVSYAVIMP